MISDYAPTEINSGGIVMAQQLFFLRQHYNVDILVYSSEEKSYEAFQMRSGQVFQRTKLGERVIRVRNDKIRRSIEFIFHNTILKFWLRNEKRHLSKILKREKYDQILISVQGLFLTKLLSRVRFHKDSVTLQYWDPDIWWAEQHNFTKHSTKEIHRVHAMMEAEEYTRNVLVPSDGMAKAISERSEASTSRLKVLYPSEKFPSKIVEPPKRFREIRESYSSVIVMAGATYALTEIKLFIEVVNEINSRRLGDEIQIIFIGPDGIMIDSRFLDKNKGFVHTLGRLGVAETDACLRNSNINFLPYPFWNRVLVEQSFPSKFSKYLGSKRNMLIAAPVYSSLATLLKSKGVSEGLVTTLSKSNYHREITKLLTDESYATTQLSKLNSIRAELFSQEAFDENLRSIFDCRDRNLKDTEIVTVEISPSKNWVYFLNTFVRSSSFFIENLKNRLHMALYYIYRFSKPHQIAHPFKTSNRKF